MFQILCMCFKKLLEIKEDLTYEERPLYVLDRKEHVLRIKVISMVKVLWNNHGVEEPMWESKKLMKTNYP